MATLQASGIGDLVTTTLNELGRLKFTDLMSDYQDTIALKRLMKKGKQTFDSGKEISFNAITGTNGSARAVGLGAQDVVDITDVMTTGSIPYRHITWNWAMEGREPIMNAAPAKIVDLVRTRRVAAMGSAIELFEQRYWRVPAAADTLNPYGIPYWIVKSNTAVTTNDGFNGSVPSGYTTVGGINPTTYPRWRNYAAQYTAVTKDDLVRKMRRAMFKTTFKKFVEDIPTYTTGEECGIFTNYDTLAALEEMLEAQNENLGNDLASKDGMTTFRRCPVTAVKELDLDTTNPVYGINWGEMHTVALRGWWMKETYLDKQPGQHTVSATHTDCSFNLISRNRRRHFVLATTTGVDY